MKYNDYKVKLTVLHEKKLNLLNDLAAKKKQVSSRREPTLPAAGNQNFQLQGTKTFSCKEPTLPAAGNQHFQLCEK